jgi:hypothetical protein
MERRRPTRWILSTLREQFHRNYSEGSRSHGSTIPAKIFFPALLQLHQ